MIVFLSRKKKNKKKIERWKLLKQDRLDYIRHMFLQYPRHICKHTEHRHTCLYLISRFTRRRLSRRREEEEREREKDGKESSCVIGRRRGDATRGLRNTRDRHRWRMVERKNRPEDFNPVKFNYKIYRGSLECLSCKGEVLGYDSGRLDRINYNSRVIFEFYTISNLLKLNGTRENLDRMFRWLLKAWLQFNRSIQIFNDVLLKSRLLKYLLKNNPFRFHTLYELSRILLLLLIIIITSLITIIIKKI